MGKRIIDWLPPVYTPTRDRTTTCWWMGAVFQLSEPPGQGSQPFFYYPFQRGKGSLEPFLNTFLGNVSFCFSSIN